MSKTDLSLIAVLVILLAGTGVYAEDWKVGEKWTFKHEGPRPFSDPTTKVEGDRTLEITAIKGEGDKKRYLLKNQWGTTDVNPATSYIDAKNRIHKIDVQDIATLLLTTEAVVSEIPEEKDEAAPGMGGMGGMGGY